MLLLSSSQDHTEVLTPAYNGYGNEDDLYAMGLSLEPLTKEVNQEEYDRYFFKILGLRDGGKVSNDVLEP